MDALLEEFGKGAASTFWLVDSVSSATGKRVRASYIGGSLQSDWSASRAADWALRGYSVLRRCVDTEIEVAVQVSEDELIIITPETNYEPAYFFAKTRLLIPLTLSQQPSQDMTTADAEPPAPPSSLPDQTHGLSYGAPETPAPDKGKGSSSKLQTSEPSNTTRLARQDPSTPSNTPPGWYPDPLGEYEYRWWNGDSWTGHVASQSRISYHPIGFK